MANPAGCKAKQRSWQVQVTLAAGRPLPGFPGEPVSNGGSRQMAFEPRRCPAARGTELGLQPASWAYLLDSGIAAATLPAPDFKHTRGVAPQRGAFGAALARASRWEGRWFGLPREEDVCTTRGVAPRRDAFGAALARASRWEGRWFGLPREEDACTTRGVAPQRGAFGAALAGVYRWEGRWFCWSGVAGVCR